MVGNPCRGPAGVIALALAVGVFLSQGGSVRADVITDPAGDFIGTYTGAKDLSKGAGAFDVLSAGGTFDGTNFVLTATLAGPVSGAPATSTPLYVWGINTGSGTSNFSAINHGGVQFNNVFTLNASGGTNNAAVTGSVNGSTVSITVPLSAVTSTGALSVNYTWNLWPRDTTQAGTAAISDFAPDNSMARFTLLGPATSFVPEPATLTVFGLMGLGLTARTLRGRRAG